jgi:hypothetical protein
MAELRLRRDREDRKRYVLDGVGELRLGRWYRRGATISSDSGASWELRSSGWSSVVTATDAGGREAATYRPRGALKRGGEIMVAEGDTFELKPSSNWRNRYALWSGESELAAVETKGWSGQEVAVDLSDDRLVEALVLLMACYLVRRFGEDSSSAAAAAG